MIHIYCGDGKGKTTAAMGLALRMAGYGSKVLLGQFFKDGSSSEIAALKQISNVTVMHCTTVPGRFLKMNAEQRCQAAADYTAYLQKLLNLADGYALLVLDEAISACNHGVIPEQMLTAFLDRLPENREVVLTGRNPSQALLERADYITEMRKIRHPFDQGITAREGIEF